MVVTACHGLEPRAHVAGAGATHSAVEALAVPGAVIPSGCLARPRHRLVPPGMSSVGRSRGFPAVEGASVEPATRRRTSVHRVSTCSVAGPSRRRVPARVRRRRAGLAAVTLALMAVLASPLLGTSGHSPAAAGPGTPGSLSADRTYVVQPGDTLWSIATRLDPSGDPRPLVAALAREAGGDTVYPGERLELP
jgi:nucleoid-associated protein YgaU